MKSKTPAYSRSITSRIVYPHDVNSTGTAYGGHILEWMDMAASICARRHSNRRVNTVAVDELAFLHPLQIGHVAKIVASISRTFRTSMEVIVDVYDEDTLTETLTLSATGVFVLVGLDEAGRPTSLPELIPETGIEKKLWEDAGRRRKQRQQKQKETQE